MNNEEKVNLITEKLEDVLYTLGLNLDNHSTKDTPHRIAKMWVNETCKNINCSNLKEFNKLMTTFDNVNPYSEDLIIIKDIDFSSMCEHHFMPFMGKVNVAYIPSEKIIGLSKVPRVVDYFSKMPQLQEDLTSDIGDYLFGILNPRFILVEIEATHTCVMCRGAESNSATNTIYTRLGYEITTNIGVHDSFIEKYRNQYFNRMR